MKEPILEKVLRKMRLRPLRGSIAPGTSIFDLGCGWEAKLLREFSPEIKKGYGIDFKVESHNLPSNVEVYQHHFQNLPWPVPAQSVESVTMLAVLEHIWPKDYSAVFEGIRTVLKPGGNLILTVPTPPAKPVLEFLAYKLGVVSEAEIRDHKVYFDETLLRKTLKEHGFEVLKYRRFQVVFNSFCVARLER